MADDVLTQFYRYPFHLRPKNKQVFQYTRMAADLIHDLELDQDQHIDNPHFENELTTEQMDGIRAYVAHCYFSSAYVSGCSEHSKDSCIDKGIQVCSHLASAPRWLSKIHGLDLLLLRCARATGLRPGRRRAG